jgi:alpha-L-rhamnosidase
MLDSVIKHLENDNFYDTDFDDSTWANAVCTEELNTEYCTSDCPTDALIEELPLTKVGNGEEGIIYDCGKNTVGYPSIEIFGERESVVKKANIKFKIFFLFIPYPKNFLNCKN